MSTTQQFSLRQLMLVVIAASVALALSTQLGASGVMASGYVIVLAVGLGLRRWNVAAAGATGLLIFVATLLALWTQLGYEKTMNQRHYYFAEWQLENISHEMRAFAKENGRFPEGFAEHPNLSHYAQQEEFSYRRTANDFEVRYLRSGQEGPGMTLDEIRDAEFDLPLTLRQFFVESMLSFAMILTALVASLLGAALWLGVSWSSTISWRRAAVSFAITVMASGVVTFLLAGLHLVASQGSGH